MKYLLLLHRGAAENLPVRPVVNVQVPSKASTS